MTEIWKRLTRTQRNFALALIGCPDPWLWDRVGWTHLPRRYQLRLVSKWETDHPIGP